MNKGLFKISILGTFLGFCVQVYLTLHHYKIHFSPQIEESFCNINATFNCDAVAASSYSTFFGIPLALLAVLTHLVLLYFLLSTYFSDEEDIRRKGFFAFILSGFVALMSVVMGTITFGVMDVKCPFCILAYLFSFIAFGALVKAISVPLFEDAGNHIASLFKTGPSGKINYLLSLLAIPVLSLLLNDMFEKTYAKDLDRVIQSSISEWTQNPQKLFSQDVSSLIYTPASNTSVVMNIVEFADFNCIHCKNAAPVLDLFKKSRKDVQLKFMIFPLDGLCNPAISRNGNGSSCQLAKATICANRQNKGWETHDYIFNNFRMDPSQIEKMSGEIGLNYQELKSCMDTEEVHNQLVAQAQLGQDSGIKGTPGIFVNGRQLPRGNYLPILQAAYDYLKKNSGK